MKIHLNKNHFILIAAIVFVIVVFAFMMRFVSIGYYNESDLLGPFSINADYFFVGAFSIAILVMVLLLGKENFKISAVVILPILFLVILKYILPTLIETNYLTSFSDAPGQLLRGLYVTNTGHSNVNIDGYYDLQPSFFWATAGILSVLNGNTLTLSSPIALFILKWFEVIMIIAFVPLLFFFYKKLLGSVSLVGIALVLQFALDSNHYHYAAQSYGIFLYWLCLAIMLFYSTSNDRKLTLTMLVVGISFVFLHQGLVIFTLVSIAAVISYPYVFGILRMGTKIKESMFSKRLWALLIIIFLSWLIYLIFMTTYTFGSFVTTLKNVFISLFSENVGLISSGMARANPVWAQLVFYKALYIGSIILLGLTLSFINARKTKSNIDQAVFTIQLFMAVFVGGLAVTLGGAGYVERILILLPLVTYSLIKFVSSAKWRLPKPALRTLAVFLLTISMLLGMVFYFSGRNFQSLTSSEIIESDYIIEHDPQTLANVYSNMTQAPASAILVWGQVAGTTYVISPHYSIYTTYYINGNSSETLDFYGNLTIKNNVIYDNGVARLIRNPEP